MAAGGKVKSIVAFDFFCGCGGTSSGFQKAGIDVAFALDIDKDAENTFRKNFPDTVFAQKALPTSPLKT